MHRILLIELSATLRHLALKLFEKNNFDVLVLNSYTLALELLESDKVRNENISGVIFGWPQKTDPDADEIIAVLSEIRNKDLHVIVLAHEADPAVMDWVTNRSMTAMVLWDDYRECVETINKISDSKNIIKSTTDFVSVEKENKIRVLFVDDSPTVRVSYRRLLRSNGYETDTAACVKEGYEKAIEKNYDIAIIDYFLPDGTGDELCQQLNANAQTNRIACAIITGTYHDKVIKDSLDAGAVECMFKNEANELFLARIASMSRMKRIMLAIEKDHKRLEGILSSVGDGVYGLNSRGLISFINPAAKAILGFDEQDRLIGMSPFSLFHNTTVDGKSVSEQDCALQVAYGTGQELIAKETVFKHKDGKHITVECTVFPLQIDGELEGSVVAFRDVTVRKLLEDELKWQATHDSLTKLANRYYFEEQLRNEVTRVKRSQEKSALLYLDLDRFKYINDTAGHAAGDKLLVEVASQLSTRLRASDTLARIGGDEFAIILRNVGQEQATEGAEAFRTLLEKLKFYYEGKSYVINVSIGVVMLSEQMQSHGEALANADLACFIAKGQGKNNVHLFVGDTDEKALMDKDLGWSVRLKEALENNLFVLHYQPIVPLDSIDYHAENTNVNVVQQASLNYEENNVKHYEVLLRLKDSRGQLIAPDAFLPTAERFNMMVEIDKWVICSAIERLANLESMNSEVVLSINLSAQSLEDKGVAEFVKKITDQYSIDPSRLLFEITENSAIANLDAANRLIRKLRQLGCQFALDDFGRGFCSFSHLKFLPVDYIKIDGIFIRGILHDSIDRAIVNSVVQIAHSVGKKTIAEYVENIEVIRTLQGMGVDYVQGYYISRPQSSPETFENVEANDVHNTALVSQTRKVI